MTDEETLLMHDCTRLVRAIYGTISGAVVYLSRDTSVAWLVVARVDGSEVAQTESTGEAVYAIREMRTWLIGRAGVAIGRMSRDRDEQAARMAALREVTSSIVGREDQ